MRNVGNASNSVRGNLDRLTLARQPSCHDEAPGPQLTAARACLASEKSGLPCSDRHVLDRNSKLRDGLGRCNHTKISSTGTTTSLPGHRRFGRAAWGGGGEARQPSAARCQMRCKMDSTYTQPAGPAIAFCGLQGLPWCPKLTQCCQSHLLVMSPMRADNSSVPAFCIHQRAS